jgi:hypothetical protein
MSSWIFPLPLTKITNMFARPKIASLAKFPEPRPLSCTEITIGSLKVLQSDAVKPVKIKIASALMEASYPRVLFTIPPLAKEEVALAMSQGCLG